MPWRSVKFVAAVMVVFATAAFPASSSAATTSDCPLAGSTAKAKAQAFDFNCSFTLAENEMFHSAPERIHKKMVNTIQNHKGKIKRIATRRLHNKKWRQKIRARTRAGRRHVDDKKADDAGRRLRDWFKRRFNGWAYIDKKAHRIGLACGVGAAMSFGLKYYYDKPRRHRLKKAEHAAIAGCFQGAVTMAIFGQA